MLDTTLLGNRIKELRVGRRLTQSAFAEALHVSPQAISNWERGIAPPDLDNLIQIAAFFGVLTDDLLRPPKAPVFLGVDGGGTKTEFVVTTADGHVLERIIKSGSNPNDVGFEGAAEVICEGIREILLHRSQLRYAFCGIAGLSAKDLRERMSRYLREQFPMLELCLSSDSANLFGMDESADLAVISGTGSVVFARHKDAPVRIGGWGYLLDPAGSAYDIGRDAVAAALAEEDGLGEATLLTDLLKRKLKVTRMFDAIPLLYSGGKPFIASLAGTVFDAYAKGDRTAIAIVEKTAERLGALLELGATKYNTNRRAIAGGGIFQHHADVLLPLLAKHTDVEPLLFDLPPVYGACRTAVRLATSAVPSNFSENFETTYGG